MATATKDSFKTIQDAPNQNINNNIVDLESYVDSDLFALPIITSASKFQGDAATGKKRKHAAAVGSNLQAIRKLFKGEQSIVDANGITVAEGDAVRRIAPGFQMDVTIVNLYMKTIIAKDKKVIILPCNFMSEEDSEATVSRKFLRYEKKHSGANFLDFDQLHLPVFKTNHFALISIERLHDKKGDEAFHIRNRCSMSKPLLAEILLLISAFKATYERNELNFDVSRWRYPRGRNTKRCASQGANGINCGVFCCYNVQRMVEEGSAIPDFRNEDCDDYRHYIASRLLTFVQDSKELSFQDVDGRKVRSSSPKRMKKTHRSAKNDVVDLT